MSLSTKKKTRKYSPSKESIISEFNKKRKIDDKDNKIFSDFASTLNNQADIGSTLNYGAISYLDTLNNFYNQDESFKTNNNKVEFDKLSNRSSIQNGGTLIHQDFTPEQAFMFFLDNSRPQKLGELSYSGILARLVFDRARAPRDSPYTPFNTTVLRKIGGLGGVGADVIESQKNNLVLKVVNIRNLSYMGVIDPFGKKLEPEYDFLQEIRVQQQIAIATSDHFEAATPYVVFGGIYDKDSDMGKKIGQVLTRISTGLQANWRDVQNSHKWWRDDIKRQYSNRIGIVVMQNGGGYGVASDVPRGLGMLSIDGGAYLGNLQRALYEFIRIAVHTGIINLDSHSGNILAVKTHRNGVYIRGDGNPNPSRLLIIDWGNITRLSPDEQRRLQELWNNRNNSGINNWSDMVNILREAVRRVEGPASQGENTLVTVLGKQPHFLPDQVYQYLQEFDNARQRTYKYYLNEANGFEYLQGIKNGGGIQMYAPFYAYKPTPTPHHYRPEPKPDVPVISVLDSPARTYPPRPRTSPPRRPPTSPPAPANENWWLDLGFNRRPRMVDVPIERRQGFWLNESEITEMIREANNVSQEVTDILANVNKNRQEIVNTLPLTHLLNPIVRQIANTWTSFISQHIVKAIKYIIERGGNFVEDFSRFPTVESMDGGYKRKTKKKLRYKINRKKTKNKKRNKVNKRKTQKQKNKLNKRKN